MKTLLAVLITVFIVNNSFSQANLETLKKENSKLKVENQSLKDKIKFQDEKMNYCTVLSTDTVTEVNSFDSRYTFKVLSCLGNRNSQSVIIELILTQNSINQDLILDQSFYNGTMAVDILGKTYEISSKTMSSMLILTDIPTRLTINVKNVMPGTESFKAIALRMHSKDKETYGGGDFKITTIKNVKIKW